MIDVHCHLIWGVDDGSDSIEESLRMVEIAAQNGTSAIVATPHSNHEYLYDAPVIEERLNALRAAVGGRVELYRGCDMHLSYENIRAVLENPERFTINAKNYLLVEFAEGSLFPTATDLFRGMAGDGIIPVITHPERNGLLRERLKDLSTWVANGCVIQITAQSLLGRFGQRAQRFSDTLIKKGLAQIVASDAHDVEWRPPRLDEAFHYVSERFGDATARRLFVENPKQAVLGGELQVRDSDGEPVSRPAVSGWRRFWG
ncbi:MAG TPA: CpsB/CapC family capsule biosynthesis tyrosine phosphatase [Bryobacteraceae bacterium]|jgi:protein-tyrosine phosphatase|nr:CpsB/CapC family capsule biosynthesis tyrosine phosphatase [Bryobacteraceae bacterium]